MSYLQLQLQRNAWVLIISAPAALSEAWIVLSRPCVGLCLSVQTTDQNWC